MRDQMTKPTPRPGPARLRERFFDATTPEGRQAGKIRIDTARMDAKGALQVGYFTSFTGALKTRGQVYVGKYGAIGDNCRMIASSHDSQAMNLSIRLRRELGLPGGGHTKGPIRVGHNVWMGDSVSIMSGVTVGNGAILAAGSVVTRDVPDFAIWGGVPARHLRWRFSESVRRQMAEVAWWHWPWARILRNKALLDLRIGPEDEIDLAEIVVD